MWYHYADNWATNSTAVEAIQTLLKVLYYLPAGSNEAIYGLYKLLVGLPLADHQRKHQSGRLLNNHLTKGAKLAPSTISRSAAEHGQQCCRSRAS